MSTDAAGSDVAGSDAAGPDVAGSDAASVDVAGSDVAGTDKVGSDAAGADKVGSPKAESPDSTSRKSNSRKSTSPETSARVLVVEDEAEIAALIAFHLTREGYRVETALSGTVALNAVQRDVPDLIVLDRMLPGLSGDEVLRSLRSDPATRNVPVMIVTARREQQDRIAGLEAGADDYLTKPFSPRELVLRVDAILRRAQGDLKPVTGGGRILRAGPLRVDVGAHVVTLDGKEITLTPTEFRLLQTLMERRGRTQGRRQLLSEAWKVDARMSDHIHTRTVDMHVRRLRGKLGPAGKWIETVRGFGYRFSAKRSSGTLRAQRAQRSSSARRG